MTRRLRAPHRALLPALLLVGLACSSGGDGGTNPTGGFTIAVNPGVLTVAQGGSGQVTVTLTRTEGFSGSVSFTVQGAPAGVTGSVTGIGGGATSTGAVTVNVGATVAPGVYNLVLRAAASGLAERTAQVTLTVTASGGFSLATTLPGVTVAQGGTGTGTVTLARTGSFNGAVALTVSGVPAGVTAVLEPATIAAGTTTADLDFTVGQTVAAGVYPLVITGAASGLPNATVNFALTVAQGAGSFTLSAAPAVLEIQQGAEGQTTVTVARTGGFTGAVSLALTGTSAGIAATFTPAVIPAGATTSQVTITVPPVAGAPAPGDEVPAATPLGDYPLVITGSAEGLPNATANVLVSVSPAPGGSFTMQIAPNSATLQAGNSAQSTLTITRTAPFVGGVSFNVTGLPANATASFAPIAIAAGGTTTQVTMHTSTAVVPGVYPLTITGIGDGVNIPDATTSYTLTVTAPPAPGAIAFQFCDPATAPLWFAYQDGIGIGPWIVVAPAPANTYSVDLSGSGGVAWVEPDGNGGFHTQVIYSSRPGILELADANCARTGGKTVTGTVSGLGLTDQALISLGTSGSAATFAVPGYTINRVPAGNRTLIASRSSITLPSIVYTTNKVVLRRNQNIADGGIIPLINFDAEGFAPVFHDLTVNNLLGWVNVSSTQYFTDNGGSSGSLVATGSGATFPSIPGAQQVAGDFHYLTATAFPDLLNTAQLRSVGRFFFAGAAQSLTLGPVLSTPTVTDAGGAGYARLQVTGTVQSNYNRFMSLTYSQTGRSATVEMTGSPFVTGGGPSYLMAFPNFSGLPGWMDSWMPATGIQATWTLFGQGWDGNALIGGEVTEGELVWTATATGNLTP